MPVTQLRVAAYRSLRRLILPVDRLSVFVGPNGTGKSNLYRAMMLLAAAAEGRLGTVLAQEGGMPSALWAGRRRKGSVRLTLGVTIDRWSYDLELGLPAPAEAALPLDPMVRRETVTVESRGKRLTMLERDRAVTRVRDAEGRRVPYRYALLSSETALAGIRDPAGFPELAMLQQELGAWRFYQHFRTDPDSPVRQPQYGICTPLLSSDGHDLAAVIATARSLGDERDINRAVADAFPGAFLDLTGDRGLYTVGLQLPNFQRPFTAPELSDGTLRYLCLVGALLGHRLPSFVALNEPEASLHPDLLEPLARLIARAAERTQLWVVTHSEILAGHLERIAGCTPRRVGMVDGETRIAGLGLIGQFRDDEPDDTDEAGDPGTDGDESREA